ncbi:MAG: phage holin family protein, partial [Oscillospiraceae bacterium]
MKNKENVMLMIVGTVFSVVGAIFLFFGISTGIADKMVAHSGDEAWVFTLVFSVLGLVFFLVGASILLVALLKNKRKKWLLQNGERLIATITNVGQDYSVSVNGRSPNVINCEYVDQSTGVRHIFKSKGFFEEMKLDLIGEDIAVYVDP